MSTLPHGDLDPVRRLGLCLEDVPYDSEDATADYVRGLLALRDRVKGDAARLVTAVEAYVLGWLRLNGGALQDGHVRYYAAPNSTTKCLDHVGATRAIAADLVLTLGVDLDAEAEALAQSTDPSEGLRAFVELLAEKLGAELAARYLSTSALKPGACKAILGEEWDSYFRKENTSKLGQDGEPEIRLQRVDEEIMDMVRKKRGAQTKRATGKALTISTTQIFRFSA